MHAAQWLLQGRVGGRDCLHHVDECDRGIAICDEHAFCQDLEGSYECLCRPGWEGSGASCQDINECGVCGDALGLWPGGLVFQRAGRLLLRLCPGNGDRWNIVPVDPREGGPGSGFRGRHCDRPVGGPRHPDPDRRPSGPWFRSAQGQWRHRGGASGFPGKPGLDADVGVALDGLPGRHRHGCRRECLRGGHRGGALRCAANPWMGRRLRREIRRVGTPGLAHLSGDGGLRGRHRGGASWGFPLRGSLPLRCPADPVLDGRHRCVRRPGPPGRDACVVSANWNCRLPRGWSGSF